MGHKILITGASGYLGGTLLNRLTSANLPQYDTLFALVRTESQAEAVKQYGAQPLTFSVRDREAIHAAILENEISIVYFLIDAFNFESQLYFIQALAELKKQTGRAVHFLHTTGTKPFGNLSGAPTDRPLLDNDPELYAIHKGQRSSPEATHKPVETNCRIVELGEELGVPVYILAPCMVYGKGEGFGKYVSIQTVAVVTAAKATRRVYKFDDYRTTWPVCHVSDTASLYIQILRRILEDKAPPSGKNGFYLASTGMAAWEDVYSAVAKIMLKRGLVDDDHVKLADETVESIIAEAIKAPPNMVQYQIGGHCTYTARRGLEIGWEPQFPSEHMLESLEEEVDLILDNIGRTSPSEGKAAPSKKGESL